MRSYFFWKLYATYVVLVVLTVATVGVLVGRRINHDSLDQVESELRVRALLLREVAAGSFNGADSLQARVIALGAAVQTRLTVIAADGTVLADSDEDPSTMDNHGNRPEVIQARVEGAGTSTRFSRTMAAQLMYYATAVNNDGQLVGYVRTSQSLTMIRQRLGEVWRIVFTVGLLVTVVALLFGVLITRRVTAPLLTMTNAAESIAGGRYSERVPASSRDEIGKLSNAFNRMAAELEKRIATITEDRGRLVAVLSGMVEGVVAVDRDLRVLLLNASAERILAVDSARSIGMPIVEVTTFRTVIETIAQAMREGQEVTDEISLHLDARERIVGLHAAPLRDGSPDATGVVLVLHDLTELRRLETVRTDFVANVSHELKTPITAIRGLVETVLDDGEMPLSTRSRFLNKAQEQSKRLSLLVTDLLTLSRLEAEDGVQQSETLELLSIVRGSVRTLQATAEAKEVRLDVDLPDSPVKVSGDRDALELVINNLLDNALKYTPAGGAVYVRVKTDGDGIVVEVEDSGIGIDKKHHDRIFERFYRVDKARSRELGGTGLGLSIVKHVCKVHGGTVGVRSAFGEGAIFTVRLPLITDSAKSDGSHTRVGL